ncbi:MAG: hypothetical protein IKL88_03780, partial [Erysipelotrichales bacterium]|nr:hypothetical protein [Erysipelotrichales bacterium]
MKKRLSKYSIFILCAAVILLCVLIFAREETLSVKLNTNNIESDVSVVLIRQYTETEYNGDVYRRHIV